MRRAPRPAQALRSPLAACGGGRRCGHDGALKPWEPCRAMAPVTEFSPCSRLVTRAYSRSRSPLSVSTAEASRRASFWLSLAANWKLLRMAGQIGRRHLVALQPERCLVGHHGQDHCTDCADAPRSNPPQHAAVEFVFLGQQTAQHAAGVVRLEAASEMVGILGQNVPGPPKACRITVQTLTGNAIRA